MRRPKCASRLIESRCGLDPPVLIRAHSASGVRMLTASVQPKSRSLGVNRVVCSTSSPVVLCPVCCLGLTEPSDNGALELTLRRAAPLLHFPAGSICDPILLPFSSACFSIGLCFSSGTLCCLQLKVRKVLVSNSACDSNDAQLLHTALNALYFKCAFQRTRWCTALVAVRNGFEAPACVSCQVYGDSVCHPIVSSYASHSCRDALHSLGAAVLEAARSEGMPHAQEASMRSVTRTAGSHERDCPRILWKR